MNRTLLFCSLALSLALISIFLMPAHNLSSKASPNRADRPMPIHSLTDISFHSVAGY
jgi:hypothetical protein